MAMPASTVFANFLLFQAAWLCGVLGAAHGRPWLGPVAALAAVAWHLARARRAQPEILLVAAALALGAAFENLLVLGGWLRFEPGSAVAGIAPVWMVALWAAFATTLNVSLRLLHRRQAIAAALGAVAAPLAYYAGARLGAVELVNSGTALLAVGVGWVVLMPVLVSLAARLDGYATP
jgi:hypothetical protein